MHTLGTLALVALSLASAVACAPITEAEATAETRDAVSAAVAKPAAKTYIATCGSRFNSAEIFVGIADGKVIGLAASFSTQDGKLRSDRTTSSWQGRVAADVSSVSASPASSSAVIHLLDTLDGERFLGAERAVLTASQLSPSGEGTVAKVVSSCRTLSPMATIELRSKVTADGVVRRISFSGVAPRQEACFSMDSLKAASDTMGGDGTEGRWDITCDAEDVQTTAEGLKELIDALTAIATP